MNRHLLWAMAALSAACVDPRTVAQTLNETEQVIEQAQAVHARICAPEHLANAESGVNFVRLEYKQGSVQRAWEHVQFAESEARLALEVATPCGTSDRDQDTIVDLFDDCPDEPEDFDGVEDEDGCRDIDPNGDEDADGIVNKDDACMFEPEDLDGHDDLDGCPEESADTDGDGLIDALDACPEDPEDVDNFRDSDGCPDPDNDADTVLDVQDSCIDVPEDLDGWEDDDGCPDGQLPRGDNATQGDSNPRNRGGGDLLYAETRGTAGGDYQAWRVRSGKASWIIFGSASRSPATAI